MPLLDCPGRKGYGELRKVSFEKWFGEQSAEKQDEILGPTRADLYRRSKISLRDLIRDDRTVINVRDLPITPNVPRRFSDITEMSQGARRKLAKFSEIQRMGRTEFADHVLKGSRFRDKGNNSNINVLALLRRGGKSYLRLTFAPDGEKLISVGIIRVKDVEKYIANGRFELIQTDD